MWVKFALGAPLALFFLVIVTSPPQAEPIGLSFGPLSVDHNDVIFLWTLYYDVFTYAFLNSSHDITALAKETTIDDVAKTVNNIASRLETMESRILSELDTISADIIQELHDSVLEEKMTSFIEKANEIQELLQDFSAYERMREMSGDNTIEFAEVITKQSSCDYVPKILRKIYINLFGVFAQYGPESFFTKLIKDGQNKLLTHCGSQSQHEILYQMYSAAIMAEAQGMYLLSKANHYLVKYGKRNAVLANMTMNHHYNQFLKRYDSYTIMFNKALKITSRGIRGCTPENGYTQDVSFLQFERFIGTVFLRKNEFTETNCSRYHDAGSRYELLCGYERTCERTHSSPNGCYGTLSNCTNFDKSLSICIGDWDNLSRRRYDWVLDKSHSSLATKECNTTKLMWQVNYLHSEEVCRCTCTEEGYQGRASHFVSLRSVTSNITNNMVLTGIKFIMTNKILQLRIQEGKLGPRGTIQLNETVQWQKSEELSYDKQLSDLKEDFVFLKRHPANDTYEELRPHIDIGILMGGGRIFYLDELHVPKGHVITGVKFSNDVWDKSAKLIPIQLEIQATPFDYENGTLLSPNLSKWITSLDMARIADNDLKGKTKRTLTDAYKRARYQIHHAPESRHPIYAQKIIPDFTPNTFIEVDKTSFDGDNGQTVIPLLDAVPVYANPPVPITALSLFHKAGKSEMAKYGGFLSFRIFTIDRSLYLNSKGMSLLTLEEDGKQYKTMKRLDRRAEK